MSMTREEAITCLQEKYDYCKSFYDLAAHPEEDYPETAKYLQALQIALSALRPITREQVAEVWKGCDLCLDDSWQRILLIPKRFDHTNMLSTELAQFCPGCGRPLTDKAVDMVMERLEVLGYGKDD